MPSVFNWSSTKPPRKSPTKRKAPCPAAAGSAATAAVAVTDEIADTELQPVGAEACGDHDYVAAPQSVDEQLAAAQQRISELESDVQSLRISRFSLQRFSNNPSLIKFYTGFPNYDCLANFFLDVFVILRLA